MFLFYNFKNQRNVVSNYDITELNVFPVKVLKESILSFLKFYRRAIESLQNY